MIVVFYRQPTPHCSTDQFFSLLMVKPREFPEKFSNFL